MKKKVLILLGCLLILGCLIVVAAIGISLFLSYRVEITSVPLEGTELIDVSNQNLSTFNIYNYNDVAVKELNLSNNKLTGSLPGEIRFMKNLEVLNISNNLFTGVPAEVGQLKNLRVLDLSNNKLTGLPLEIGNLSNLETLNISGNDYSQQDLAAILQKLPTGVKVIK